MASSANVDGTKRLESQLTVNSQGRLIVPIVSSPPKSFEFQAADLIDPSIGFHALERTDTMLGFSWSGAAPAIRFRERIDRSSPVFIHAVIMSFAPGVAPSDLRLLIDHQAAPVRIVEEFGMNSLYAEAPPHSRHLITLEFTSPIFQETGKAGRRLGFALVSIRATSAG